VLTVIEICPLAAIRNCPLAATSVAECDCLMRCGAPRAVDRCGALLLSDLLADHPDERLGISWERSSLEDHGQLGGDLL
jgi:hypothetical protein